MIIQMNIIAYSVSISILLSSCLTVGKEYMGNLKPTPPSQKELRFIDSLKREGFSNVKLDIPIPTYTGKGYAFYCIDMKPPFLYDWTKRDSIRLVMREIANKLYSQIIEDSIIIEFRSISVTLHTKSTNGERKDIAYDYEKNELELNNGFRVVQDSLSTYRRIIWTTIDAEKERIEKQKEEEENINRIIEQSDSFNKANGF